MLRPLRYIAVDFETTGLDLSRDEPLQIGIVEFDSSFQVVQTFSSLIKPLKPLSELKSVVSRLTQLDVEQIQHAPSCEQLLPQISGFFGEGCVIIGHTVSFDVRVLERFFGIRVQHTVDTFVLGQTLFHYQPSHSLESLHRVFSHDALAQLSGEAFQQYLKSDQNGFHDALFDSFAAAQLFAYFVRKVEALSIRIPVLPFLLNHSEGIYRLIFDFGAIPRPDKLALPALQQPLPSQTSPASSRSERITLPEHENKLFVGHL
jgi:DNA polymerase III epsilon subunit-like protein